MKVAVHGPPFRPSDRADSARDDAVYWQYQPGARAGFTPSRHRKTNAHDEPPARFLIAWRGRRDRIYLRTRLQRPPPWSAGRRADCWSRPPASRNIINRVLAPPNGHPPDLQALYVALGITSGALVLANVAIYYQTYLTAWSGQHLIAQLRIRLFERLLNLPLETFDRWRPGELIARFSTDLQLMTDAVSVSLPQLVVALVTFVSSFADDDPYLDWAVDACR